MSKKWIKCLITALLLSASFATGTWAQSQGSANSDVAGPSRLFGAVEWFNAHTRIDPVDADVGKLDSNMWGGMVGYQFAQRQDWYFEARGMWSGGKGDKTVDDTTFNVFSHPWFVEGRLGYQFGLGEGQEFGITPYVGYMYMANKSSLANTDFDGIFELSGIALKMQQQNVNVGVLFDWMVMPQFQVGLNVEALIGVWGKLKLMQNDTTVEEGKFKNNVNWMFELPLTWQFSPTWDLTVVPFYNWIENKPKDNSDFTEQFDDISNSSAGVRLEVGYRF